MTDPVQIRFDELDLDALAGHEGRVAVLVGEGGRLDRAGRRVNRLTRGALARFAASDAFTRLKPGEVAALGWPAGMAARELLVVRLDRRAGPLEARKAGAALGARHDSHPMLVAAGSHPRAEELAFGLGLRAYAFTDYKDEKARARAPSGPVCVAVNAPEKVAASARDHAALTEGVFFARDLVNEPANTLGTEEFAARLAAMQELGLDVEILTEAELTELGMNALLGVAQGSARPPRVVIMRWQGADAGDPVALIGKGVVFDTGGISLKPASGMEEMTMDMGGAAVVAGVMRALALRRAPVNAVGVVGLVENMPDGRAQRPGDIVRTMKGDTVEVINTDAEGRLVLADIMWLAQERFRPAAMIDLATLTGAMIIALGHENAGIFANDDALADALLAAARAEGEGAWRLPLGEPYAEQLKSDKADVKNVGGRPAGAITAAEFLRRYVKEGTPWAHIDIAGVAQRKKAAGVYPKGATGWGVLTLDRLLRERFERRG